MKTFLGALIVGLSILATAAAVEAKGTVQVQKVGYAVQTYQDVTIRVIDRTLKVTTADQKGTLIIDKAACSYVGDLQMCLPDHLKLQQGGVTRPIDIQRGTAYVNLTAQNQALPQSFSQIPPNGILLSLTTKIGTIINLTGTIDEVSK